MNNRKTVKKNKNVKSTKIINKEILSIILIVSGIIIMFSLFSNKMGIVGTLFYKFFSLLGGSGNFLFPLTFIILGIVCGSDKYNNIFKHYLIISIVFILCILTFLDGTKSSDLTLVDRINLSIEYLDITRSGGVIGAILGFFCYKLFGSLGTYVLLTLILIVCFYFIFKFNFEYINVLKLNFSNNYNKIKQKYFENNIPRSAKKESIKGNRKPKKDSSSLNNENNILIRDYTNANDLVVNDILEENSEVLYENNTVVSKKDSFKKNVETISIDKEEIIKESNEIDKEIKSSEKEVGYVFPPVELLDVIESKSSMSNQEIINNGKIIEQTMENFGIASKIVAINKGPVITCYELQPDPGVKLSKIVALNDNISMSLASSDIRIEAPIPGKSAVGIEVPNKSKESVSVREIIESKEFKELNSDLPLALGKDVSGSIVISSIDKMPHLLIAGATGSGKSVCINTIITNIIYKSSPKDVRLMLIDPKVVELSIYNGIPHLLIPVVTDPKKAAYALNWAVNEMEKRYKLFAENSVRDLNSYNKKISKEQGEESILPKIVVIVDELADLMMVAQSEVEDYIARLAQMARAAGIYLIIATQRPSVDVITGTIKANIPSRIAFSVSSQIDSRTILDMAGAEKLLGKGDMLFYPGFYSKPKRVQGSFISDEEVERIVDFIKINGNEENSIGKQIIQEIEDTSKNNDVNSDRDPLFKDAINFILQDEQASISFLQRKLKVGYARAARIVDQIEEAGIIGPHEGSKPRKLLLNEEEIKILLGEKNE